MIHLHVHTEYSINDSLAKITDLVSRAKELGMEALATTDHGNLFSVIHFYKECKKQGVKPIIGTEAYICPLGKEEKVRDNRHIVLLCKNETGYKNLMAIMSDAAINGFYYNPRTDYDFLRQHSEGLILLTACLGGDVAKEISTNGYEAGKEKLELYIDIFGKENVYIEIQDNGIKEQYEMNELLIKLSEVTGVPLVATNDVHYVRKEDYFYHDALMAIQAKTSIASKNRKIYGTDELYLKSDEEMRGSLPDSSIDITHEIASRCNVEFEFGNYQIPKFDISEFDVSSSEELLYNLAYEGFNQRYEDKSQTERLEYELSVIKKMGYVDYFLITWDFIKWCKDNDIMIGPGRGSAAGSMLSYCLDITTLDPIEFGLIFERFLNPSRVSMPDIDIDVCKENRHLLLEYMYSKYGREYTCQIITFGTYGAKGAIRASGRALDLPYMFVDNVSKLIPSEAGIKIEEALVMSQDLENLYNNNDDAKQLIDTAMAIEGLPAHSSTHAGGILVTPNKLHEHIPLWNNKGTNNKGTIVSQFDMNTLEELGLLKIDLLGLRNLTIISNACKNIGISPDDIDVYDKEMYKLTQKGCNEGIFQIESEGMKETGKYMSLDSLPELIALIALYRPGPMDFIPSYIARKKGVEEIDYIFDSLKDVLEETYGIIVYQEQVMFISQILSGYTMAQADDLRKAMGKKKMDLILKHRESFIEGAVKNEYSEERLNSLYDSLQEFAKYAFNKSHAAAYAIIAAMTCWLKYYYPREYMASLLSSWQADNTDKLALYIKHCECELGIKVLPPSINVSGNNFAVDRDGNIRFSLTAIKSVGDKAVNQIVAERNKEGEFISFSNFVRRCCYGNVKKNNVEALAKVGSFDEFGIKRSQLVNQFQDIIEYYKKIRKSSQVIVSDDSDSFIEIEEYPDEIKFKMEKDYCSFYMSGHPLDKYKRKLNNLQAITTRDLENADDRLVVAGTVIRVKSIVTKKGDDMCFLDIEDRFGTANIVVFPSCYKSSKNVLNKGELIVILGKIQRNEEEVSVIANKIKRLADIVSKEVYVVSQGKEELLLEIVQKCKGNITVYAVIGNKKIRIGGTSDEGLEDIKKNFVFVELEN